MVIYVDDFKLAGPTHVLPDVWKLLRKGIRMDDPTPLGKYPGCGHIESQRTHPETGAPLRVLEHDMSSFLQSRVDRYLELAGLQSSDVRKVQTPFLHEDKEPCPARDVCPVGSGLASGLSVGSSSFVGKVGSLQVGSSQLGNASSSQVGSSQFVETGHADHEDSMFPDQGSDIDSSRGRLQPIAARVLMKILYAARMARYDLLMAVNSLSSCITKWTIRCDRRLHRLVAYIASTLEYRLTGWVSQESGQNTESFSLDLYVDADHSGCHETMRSTSGVFLALTGTDTFWPLSAVSKKQVSPSHSTPEAEIVAYAFGARTVGLPALILWRLLLSNMAFKVKLTVHEDNSAMIQVCDTGKNPNMRYINLTQATDVAWLHELSNGPYVDLVKEASKTQAADIFTKPFPSAPQWQPLLRLIGMLTPSFWVRPAPVEISAVARLVHAPLTRVYVYGGPLAQPLLNMLSRTANQDLRILPGSDFPGHQRI